MTKTLFLLSPGTELVSKEKLDGLEGEMPMLSAGILTEASCEKDTVEQKRKILMHHFFTSQMYVHLTSHRWAMV